MISLTEALSVISNHIRMMGADAAVLQIDDGGVQVKMCAAIDAELGRAVQPTGGYMFDGIEIRWGDRPDIGDARHARAIAEDERDAAVKQAEDSLRGMLAAARLAAVLAAQLEKAIGHGD